MTTSLLCSAMPGIALVRRPPFDCDTDTRPRRKRDDCPHFSARDSLTKQATTITMNFSIALVTLLFPSAVSAQLRAERQKLGKLASVDEKPTQPDKFASASVVEQPQRGDFDIAVKPIKPPIGLLRPTQRPTRKIDIIKRPTQSPTPACETTCDTDAGKSTKCQI